MSPPFVSRHFSLLDQQIADYMDWLLLLAEETFLKAV